MKNILILLLGLSFSFSALASLSGLADGTSRVYNRTIEYWSLRLEPTYNRTIEYWTPVVHEYTEEFEEYFHTTIHPTTQKYYGIYLDKYGHEAARNFMTSYNFIMPKFKEVKENTLDYYRSNHPITLQYLSDVPAFIKKGYEKGIISIWQWLNTVDEEQLETIGEDKLKSLSMTMAAGEALKEGKVTEESIILGNLLDDIRGSAIDQGMMDCYRVIYFDAEVKNAFNIGCNIFFSKSLYDFVEGNQSIMRAILAHEMAHGDAGHGIKTFSNLSKSFLKHSAHLIMNELDWLTTGGQKPYLDKVLEHGHEFLIMDDFGHSTIRVEMEADRRGVQILNRAGYSAEPLIEFLTLVSEGNVNDCGEHIRSSTTLRTYPSMCKRIDAIKGVMAY